MLELIYYNIDYRNQSTVNFDRLTAFLPNQEPDIFRTLVLSVFS